MRTLNWECEWNGRRCTSLHPKEAKVFNVCCDFMSVSGLKLSVDLHTHWLDCLSYVTLSSFTCCIYSPGQLYRYVQYCWFQVRWLEALGWTGRPHWAVTAPQTCRCFHHCVLLSLLPCMVFLFWGRMLGIQPIVIQACEQGVGGCLRKLYRLGTFYWLEATSSSRYSKIWQHNKENLWKRLSCQSILPQGGNSVTVPMLLL